MAARTNPIYDVTPRDIVDKWVLFLAFLLGGFGAFTLKVYETTPFFVAFWSALVLLTYAAAAWRMGRLRIEAETIGDNCYYLGFVFTLASLAGTLYLLAESDEQAKAIRDVVSGFGVALISTILGITLRVLFIRMSPDMASLDRESRVALHAAVRNFRTNLSASLRELKHFSIETAQMLSEQRDAIHEVSKETIETHEQVLKAGMEEQARMINETLAAATGNAVVTIADAVAKTTTVAHEELLNSIAGMREAVTDLARKESETLKALVADSAGIAGESIKVQAALEDFAGEIVHFLSEQRDEIRKASKETIELHGQVLQAGMKEQARMINETLAAATGNAAETIEDAVVKAITVAHEELLKSIGGMREAVADLARKESETLKALVADSAGISGESVKVQAALEDFSAETVQFLAERRDEIRKASKETIEIHEQVLQTGMKEQARMINETLAAAAGNAAETIEDVVVKATSVAHEELLKSIGGMREAVADLARKESETLKMLVGDSSGISTGSAKVQDALEELVKRFETVLLNLDAVTKDVPRENGPTVNPPAETSQESDREGSGSWWRSRPR